jgi:PAS domain-containing protein
VSDPSAETGIPTDQFGAAEFGPIFDKTPGLYLILDTNFKIVAANDAYCQATKTQRSTILGQFIFEAFPDNPADSSADGVQNLRASLLRVLKNRAPDRMNIQKYDIPRRDVGGFEERYWSPLNIPVIGADRYVKWIIHSIEDVTELMNLRAEFAARRDSIAEHQKMLTQLHEAQRELAAKRDENEALRQTLGRKAKG